jgi:threonine/homoserine/homoserine lactone efflux protein
MHPIETGNIILIILGIVMFISGPWILYGVVKGYLKAKRENKTAEIQKFNAVTNLVIGVILFFAGILFVVNNLRGNPLHFKPQAHAEGLVR